MTISQNITIYTLKNAISSLLKIPLGRLRIKKGNKKIVLDENYDKEYLQESGTLKSNFNLKDSIYYIEVLPRPFPQNQTPSYSIANNEECKKFLLGFMNLYKGIFILLLNR